MIKKSGRILVVDDNETVLKSLKLILKNEFEKVETLKNPNQLHSLLTTTPFDVILLDMNFKAGINTGNEGLYWLSEVLKINPDSIVIMLTAYGDIELSVEAMKKGATDFIVKPWDNEKLIATIKTGLKLNNSQQEIKSLKQKQEYLGSNDSSKRYDLIGSSPAFLNILEIVNKVAQTDANVLILGENGTGKELIAQENTPTIE